MRGFNPRRLALARERRGLTKKALAGAVGVVPRSITAYESGELQPGDDTVNRLANVLGFPRSFFEQDDPPESAADTASFRSLARMTASLRVSVLAAGTMAMELNAFLEERFSLPGPDLPDLRDEDPERAATALRAYWNLGERPIPNVLHLLEAKGVRIFSLAGECEDVDAFCMWHRKTPYVFLNTSKSGERGRFDAAHELGHLVLHRHGVPRGKDLEAQADKFASAFLMPRAPLLAAAPRVPTPANLVALKRSWRVSVAALARRLYELGCMSQWHYDNACIQISKRGWRKTEPQSIPREVSQLLRKAFDVLREEGTTPRHVAAALNIVPADLNALVFGILIHAVDGAGQPTRSSKRPPLKLVQ